MLVRAAGDLADPIALGSLEDAVEHLHAKVHRSAQDVLEHSPILQQEAGAGKLALIKTLYRLESGEVVPPG